MSNNRVKLIYNPHAGGKRRALSGKNYSLEDIKALFERYMIPVDYFPSKSVADAINLAKDSRKEGYEIVAAAGGDGTVATIAQGLVGTDTALAILPMGSVMNVANMLAIPNNLELAVSLIKIGRKIKIDVGQITRMDGEKLDEPSYFLEQAGVGFDADYHYYLTEFLENKDFKAIIHLLKLLIPLFGPRIEVTIDDKVIEKKARMVIVSNGPKSGPGLDIAPTSKLNDHSLTTSVYAVSKIELARYLFDLLFRRKTHTKKIKVYHSDKVKINSKDEKMIHADARVFGTTPAEFKIVPSSLTVIAGFPPVGNSALKTRTFIDS